jgi:nuclear transport factor 2 (NTF2) superfamily protein
VDRDAVDRWVGAYERAWRSPGTEQLAELFTEDVSYFMSPWAEAVQGLDAVAELWESEREGPDEPFTMTSEIVALDGDRAVVRVAVDYHRDRPSRWRDLWLVDFGGDGRCARFEEWPFAPDQRDGHEGTA